MSEDLIKVVLDYNLSSNEDRKNVPTGHFIFTPIFEADNYIVPNPELIFN